MDLLVGVILGAEQGSHHYVKLSEEGSSVFHFSMGSMGFFMEIMSDKIEHKTKGVFYGSRVI